MVAAHLRLTPKELSERTGIQFEISQDGFDYMEAALIQSVSGRQFGLFRYQHSPIQRYTALVIQEGTENLTEALNDALQSLSIDTSEVI